MPGHVRGPFSDPSRGDSGRWISDAAATLARVEHGQAVLAAAVAELGAQLADLSRHIADAETAGVPVPSRYRAVPRRPGGPFLRVM